MPVDYDTPRPADTDDDTPTPSAGVAPQDGQLWEEIGDGATFLALGTADIFDDAADVVIPFQDNEFTCVECFLIHPLPHLDHRTLLGAVCTECAS